MIFEPNIIFLESAQNIAIMVLFENRVKFPTLCKKNHWDIISRCKTASLRKSSTHLRFVSREVRHRCPTPSIRKKAPRVTKIDFAPRNLARGLLNSSMEGAARHGGGGCELDGGGCEARIRSPPHPSSSPLHLEGAATPCPTKCDPEIWPMPDIFEP